MDAHDQSLDDVAALPRILLVATGVIALSAGILVYLADRLASRAILIPDIEAFRGHPLFGALGQWLPSFVHPFAFSLFTSLVLKPGQASHWRACAFWGAVNVAFEVGQHPAFRASWAHALQGPAGGWAITRSVLNYLLRGTFDPYDLSAAVLGALTAGAVLKAFDRRPGPHHEPR